MKLLVVFTALIVGTIALSLPQETSLLKWAQFKSTHGKSYEGPEEIYRKTVFLDNLKKIQENNELYAKGEVSYKLGVNQFADLTTEEFSQRLNRFKRGTIEYTQKYTKPVGDLPEKIDWRDFGSVTPVKNQLSCGSCWSFSATGALEGQHFFRTGNLTSFSEQELVDCSKEDDNAGCDGGEMTSAFKYVIKNGLSTEEDYPYEAVDGVCRRNNLNSAVTALSFVQIGSNEDELEAAVAFVGPISVAVNADSWGLYEEGVYVDAKAGNGIDDLNHGVLAVGYGVENGKDYWLIKNSWGGSWGEKGYMKLARNANNNCGIATDTCFPAL